MPASVSDCGGGPALTCVRRKRVDGETAARRSRTSCGVRCGPLLLPQPEHSHTKASAPSASVASASHSVASPE